jgi:cell division protein ZapE
MIENREILALRTCDDVAWFDFRELCDGPRSQNDYIELGKIFHAVLLSGVEQMSVTTDDIARRFINMVDEFYDRNVKLIISAEVELKDLYTGGRLNFEFQRTLSRLLEMQSHEFLSRPHKPYVAKGACPLPHLITRPAETAADTGSATARCAGGTGARRSSHRRSRPRS